MKELNLSSTAEEKRSYYDVLKDSNKSTRKVLLKGYWEDSSVIEQMIGLVEVRAYRYALHDCDTHTDDNGDVVPTSPHYHICLEFENPQRLSTIYRLFRGDMYNVNVTVPKNFAKGVEYLVHKNNPEKHQYDPSVVKGEGDFTLDFNDSNRAITFLDDILAGMNFYELVKKHGNYAIMNYERCVRSLGNDFLHDLLSVQKTVRHANEELEFLSVIRSDLIQQCSDLGATPEQLQIKF